LFNRQVAWPADHGTWAFFLAPLLIGLAAGGRAVVPSAYLVAAALAGFLLRQPITIAIKILSRRRPRRDLTAAIVWSTFYLSIALLHLVGLALRGFGFVLVLAIPGIAVFAWHLALVARRDERGRKEVEILGAGVLALSAPACYWIGAGHFEANGWILWVLCWIFSTMSIVHVHARLEQRQPAETSPESLRAPARRALRTNSVLLAAVVVATFLSATSPLLPLPFLVQWSETAQAAFTFRAAPKPTSIGMRQLVVSAVATALFIVVW
jgi:hypothetical protein